MTYKEEKIELLRKLIEVADRALAVRDDSGASWEERYHRIFGVENLRVNATLRALGWSTDWYDPDTSYQEDVEAYCRLVEESRDRALSEIQRLE